MSEILDELFRRQVYSGSLIAEFTDPKATLEGVGEVEASLFGRIEFIFTDNILTRGYEPKHGLAGILSPERQDPSGNFYCPIGSYENPCVSVALSSQGATIKSVGHLTPYQSDGKLKVMAVDLEVTYPGTPRIDDYILLPVTGFKFFPEWRLSQGSPSLRNLSIGPGIQVQLHEHLIHICPWSDAQEPEGEVGVKAIAVIPVAAWKQASENLVPRLQVLLSHALGLSSGRLVGIAGWIRVGPNGDLREQRFLTVNVKPSGRSGPVPIGRCQRSGPGEFISCYLQHAPEDGSRFHGGIYSLLRGFDLSSTMQEQFLCMCLAVDAFAAVTDDGQESSPWEKVETQKQAQIMSVLFDARDKLKACAAPDYIINRVQQAHTSSQKFLFSLVRLADFAELKDWSVLNSYLGSVSSEYDSWQSMLTAWRNALAHGDEFKLPEGEFSTYSVVNHFRDFLMRFVFKSVGYVGWVEQYRIGHSVYNGYCPMMFLNNGDAIPGWVTEKTVAEKLLGRGLSVGTIYFGTIAPGVQPAEEEVDSTSIDSDDS